MSQRWVFVVASAWRLQLILGAGGCARTGQGEGRMKSRAVMLLAGAILASGCTSRPSDDGGSASRDAGAADGARSVLKLVSGSENEALFSALDENGKVRKDTDGRPVNADLVRTWERDNKVAVQVSYAGSVDIMEQIAAGKQCEYDMVCPAATTWITLGNDQSHIVKDVKAIQFSPLVYGVESSLA